MVRALVAVWLFAGCRIDEICRLELGCVIWNQTHNADTGEPFTACLLRVPANKTSTAFTKPVDPIVGQLIQAWHLVRHAQPLLADRKTGQRASTCSAIAANASAAPTSTTSSSQRYAARPASVKATPAAR